MTEKRDRRSFMKQSAAIVSGLALAGCEPRSPAPETPPVEPRGLEPETLGALADVVLPRRALGEDGVRRVVEGFRAWLDGLEPGAELDHPYIWTDEILYGPPHPGPAWTAELEALELESSRRHGVGYSELTLGQREAVLREQLPESEETNLPEPARAAHVALGLLAYFYATPEANDLCYEARIERHSCRGLDSAPDAPERS